MSWGAVDAKAVVKGAVKERFERFREALRSGDVVPLLGAGVSSGSVPRADELLKALEDEIEKQPGASAFAVKRSGNGEFAKLAEVLYWQTGNAIKVCETLGIKGWTEKTPTRAHRYLALLACEGLITEVVTTNWDCCLETAWRQARGLRDDAWQPITCAEELSRPGGPNERHHLRLYKINGCAGRLRRKWDEAAQAKRDKKRKKAEAAEEIMVTERQLQQFGKRRWAGDLVKVLLRSRQIVFSGFGSDEPQIWHVVQDILEEFEAGTAPENGNVGDHRSLWACEYGCTIAFHILQALVGENRKRRQAERLSFPSVFSGNDAAFFAGNPVDKLDAGDFWRMAWLAAVHDTLKDVESVATASFAGHVLGRRYRSDRPEDRLVAQLWERLVRDVFPNLKSPPPWLEEPVPFEVCAPEILCLRYGYGAPSYVSIYAEQDYWILLILTNIISSLTSVCQINPTRVDCNPQIEIRCGGVSITTGFSTSPPIGPMVNKSDSEKSLSLRVCWSLLERLSAHDNSRHKPCGQRADAFKESLWVEFHGLLHHSRHEERSLRRMRRKQLR